MIRERRNESMNGGGYWTTTRTVGLCMNGTKQHFFVWWGSSLRKEGRSRETISLVGIFGVAFVSNS